MNNSNSTELKLTEGEEKLIKALREAGGVKHVPKYGSSLLVESEENEVVSSSFHISFISNGAGGHDLKIINALMQIKEEYHG